MIDLNGGVIQAIWTTCENTDFTVIDWDNIDGGQGENDLYEMGDYPAEVKTEGEILKAINEANQQILENNEFFNDDSEYY